MVSLERVYKGVAYFGVAVLVTAATVFLLAEAAPDSNPGIAADRVLGQADFTGATANTPSTSVGVFGPEAVCADGSRVIVSDATNNRVLIWNSGAPSSGSEPTTVLGQADLTGTTANRGGAVAANTLSYPMGVSCDGSKIYVADYGNNRILIWNSLTPVSGSDADIVLGQADFTGGSANRGGATGQNTLSSPRSVYSDGSKIYVADSVNNRVLIWNTTAPTSGANADIVLGQSNFTSNTSYQAGSTVATGFGGPYSVASDGTRIYVADSVNHRALIWNTIAPTNGQAADIVLGQDTFTGYSANKGGTVSSSTLSNPTSIYSDGSNIFIGDNANERVLIWTSTAPANGSGAQMVVGKSVFDDTTLYDTGTSTLRSVGHGIAFSSPHLWVPDVSGNRILRFDLTPNTPGAPIFSDVSTSTMTVNFVSSSGNFSMAEYAIQNTLASLYVTAAGEFGVAETWAASSTWSSSPVINLTPGQPFSFKTKARYIAGLASSLSNATSTYTLPVAAGSPTIGTPTSTATLPLTIAANGNHASVQYAVFNTTTQQYVAADGSSTETAVFQTAATWGTVAVTGLATNTPYAFVAVARNGNSDYAATSTASTDSYTLAATTTAPSVTAMSSTALAISFTAGDTATSTTYAIYNVTDGTFLDSIGNPSPTASYQASSTWEGTVAAGLTPNTAYQFSIIPANGNSITSATSTASTAVYTYASAPSSVAASAGQTSMTISWSGNGSEYYIADAGTASRNSGWISETSYAFTGLTCGTTYTFTVKAKNAAGTETSNTSISAATSGCGGGGVAPSGPLVMSDSVKINNGATVVSDRAVELNFSVNAVQIAVSNRPDFAQASFKKYVSSMRWTLTEGEGEKVVYVRFRSASGGVSTVSKNVTFALPKNKVVVSPLAPVTPKPTGSVSICPYPPGPYRSRLSPSIWLVTPACTKQAFSSSAVYFSHFSTWKDVIIISEKELQAIPVDPMAFAPMGPNYRPPHGTFVRVSGDSNLYYLIGNKRDTIDAAAFTQMKYVPSWIVFIDPSILDRYEARNLVTSTKKHLDLTLIKYKDSPKVYILEWGKKRHIINEQVFMKRGYRTERIVTIDASEQYPDGDVLDR